MKKIISVILCMLCLSMGIVAFTSCKPEEEKDPYEDSYGTYELSGYSYSTRDGSSGGHTDFENMLLGLSKEEADFIKKINAFVGEYIEFSKEGIKFNGEFKELVPYTIGVPSPSSFYIHFALDAFPDGIKLNGRYSIGPSSKPYYAITIDSFIRFGENLGDPYLDFEMGFIKQ